ncbi:hypothetical protein Vafri_5497 [Volvox africanus]|uniref:Chitin-binding type-1 domain-containing protein n=1 Tax=Volvox africanus TaxID=51714 RepID=A0A8J4EYH1_9CHLO|nr:hypothetical protein Vafri_5497 [Volvox africanus]
MCSNITNARIYLAASSRIIATNVTLRVLVMVISTNQTSKQCKATEGANVKKVKDAFLGPGGYADFFANCSYGRMVFDRQMLTVVSTVIPCNITSRNYCNEETIATQADLYLPQEIPTGYYSYFVYVLPNDEIIAEKCLRSAPGVGEIPGYKSWFMSGDKMGIFSKATVMQEMLHNFGLHHGWRNKEEYADFSTAMGRGTSCPSAPELWRLGWATPLAELNSSTFPKATYMNFTLPATYLGPTGAMIKIQPDWLNTNYTMNLYLSLRVKAAGDKDLIEKFNGKLSIHEVNRTIDSSRDDDTDPKTTIIGELTPGDNSSLIPSLQQEYKLLLLVGAFNNRTSTIIVTICQFVNGPDECTFAALPPPPPNPPSPTPPSPTPPSRTPPSRTPPSRTPPSRTPPSSRTPPPSPTPPPPTPPPPTPPPPTPPLPTPPSPTPPLPTPPSPTPPSPTPPPPTPPPPTPPSPTPPSPTPPSPTPPSPTPPPPTPPSPTPPSPTPPSPTPPSPTPPSPTPPSPTPPSPTPPSPPTPPKLLPPPPPRSPPPTFPPKSCGEGTVGNSICPIATECCSIYGWCGITEDYCNPNDCAGGPCQTPPPLRLPQPPSLLRTPPPLPFPPSPQPPTPLPSPSPPSPRPPPRPLPPSRRPPPLPPPIPPIEEMCGDGLVGNGRCINTIQCCSQVSVSWKGRRVG